MKTVSTPVVLTVVTLDVEDGHVTSVNHANFQSGNILGITAIEEKEVGQYGFNAVFHSPTKLKIKGSAKSFVFFLKNLVFSRHLYWDVATVENPIACPQTTDYFMLSFLFLRESFIDPKQANKISVKRLSG